MVFSSRVPAKSAASRNKQEVIICGECDKLGHLMINCPCKKSSKGDTLTTTMAAEPDDNPDWEAIATSAIWTNESSDRDVLIDYAGASQHVTLPEKECTIIDPLQIIQE